MTRDTRDFSPTGTEQTGLQIANNAPMHLQTIQLRALAALAEYGSYTRVARELSYTEPAVNMQIKSLERAVGLPLVRREGKRIQLTSEALQLLPAVLETLESHRALEARIRRLRPASKLVIGAGQHSGIFAMMPALSDYQRSSSTEIELHLLSAGELVRAMLDGRVEVVVAGIADDLLPREQRLRSQLVRVPWMHADLEWVIVADPAITACRLPSRSRGSTTVFVPASMGSQTLDALTAACHEYFAEPRISVLETADAVLGAANNGLGAAVLPAYSMHDWSPGALRILGTVNSGPITVHLLHARTRALSPEARRFVAHLVARRKPWVHVEARPTLGIVRATGSRRTSERHAPAVRLTRTAGGSHPIALPVPEMTPARFELPEDTRALIE